MSGPVDFSKAFLTPDAGPELAAWVESLLPRLSEHFLHRRGPTSGWDFEEIQRTFQISLNSTADHARTNRANVDRANVDRASIDRTRGEIAGSRDRLFETIFNPLFKHSVNPSHPLSVAHLHCPTLTAAVASELVIGALNQSMDSFDQAPFATHLEKEMVRWWLQQIGYGEGGDGVFTSGGTQSNLMGLMLARDGFYADHPAASSHQSVRHDGNAVLKTPWILTSEASHFSVEKSAHILGLGEKHVIKIATDPDFRMDPVALESCLLDLQRQGQKVMAIVATSGTTDFGSYDPLARIADLAERFQTWLHVDAAVGGALLLSPKHRLLLAGLERADSITVDFHKLFYQPVSCGAFFVKDAGQFSHWARESVYLDRVEDRREGIENLVGKSLQTTRRLDALKILVSLQYHGLEFFAAAVDHGIELTKWAAEFLDDQPDFVCLHWPMSQSLVFQYIGDRGTANGTAHDGRFSDQFSAQLSNQLSKQTANRRPEQRPGKSWLQHQIRRELWRSGSAVIGETKVKGETCLKLTLINPLTSQDDLRALFSEIRKLGQSLIHKAQSKGERA